MWHTDFFGDRAATREEADKNRACDENIMY
jgi:hypothetical protein